MLLKPMGTPGKCPVCVRAWTPEEDELLISLHPSMTYKEMTARLDRTERAIRARARHFIQSGILPPKRNHFTPAHDSFIRANRHRMTISEVAAYLGRREDAVSHRAQRIKARYKKTGDFHRSTKYPDSDVELIRLLRDDGLKFSVIAGKFEMPESSVKAIYHRRQTAIDAIAREYLPR
ncbi:AsnC family protein [Salmonella enterica]|nr:AsnC family protein [Salmonella enterica]